jgi:hypothetical protein
MSEEDVQIVLPNGTTFPRKVYSAYTKEELTMIIGCCKNITDMLDTLRLNRFYYRYIKKFIEDNNINVSHFTKDTTRNGNRKSIESQLVKKSNYLNSTRVKEYLLKNKLIVNECALCKLQPLWNGKQLTLQLDHINGDHYDNRVENLRLICPNCHSQTDTYTGRNVKRHEDKVCQDCKKSIKNSRSTERCAECIAKRKSICSVCETNTKYGNWSKCKECLMKEKVVRLCKVCKEEITRATNKTLIHKKCFTKQTIEKNE